MRLYSYIVTHDTGFSPNPFWGCCTLADCKPTIRRTAQLKDWIVGLSPKASGNKLIFAMQVAEILSYENYYRDSRFATKIPNFNKGAVDGNTVYRSMELSLFSNMFGCLTILAFPVTVGGTRVMATGTERN